MRARHFLPHAYVYGAWFVLSYLTLFINALFCLFQARPEGWIAPLFAVAAILFHSLLYLIPAFVLTMFLDAAIACLIPERKARLRAIGFWSSAVVFMTLTHMLLFGDRHIYDFYDYHINGFVWNLVVTEGGMDAMGGSGESYAIFSLFMLAFALLQITLMLLLLKSKRVRPIVDAIARPRRIAAGISALLLLGMLQAVIFGFCSLVNYGPVLASTDAIPLYQGITFRRLARKMGYESTNADELRVKHDRSAALIYPLKPIERDAPLRPNILLIISESWRWDMLNPEIMPATWAFSQKCGRFTQHYSSGNGTRMAIFGMFYGLYGPYWFQCLKERRSPVLMDLLMQDNYRMALYSSATWTYPEFDQTVFSRVPLKCLHQNDEEIEGWRCDRKHVGEAMEFMKQKDGERPFFTFMFLESPHARYYFPEECVIAKPYLENLNYATVDPERDALLIKNRYINSCRHLDTQLARLFEFLESESLFDSTIVIVTGDHGEEFMENGHWGHNSAFNEEQTHVPLLLWAPGQDLTTYDYMTSHLDVPATILPLLGVKNPPEDYSLGFDMLGPVRREYVIFGGWNTMGYADDEYFAAFPVIPSISRSRQTLNTINGQPVSDMTSFLQSRRDRIRRIVSNLARFSK